jgi:hypothetical protein
MVCTFDDRFGFEEIFCAIGFGGVVVGAVVDGPAVVDGAEVVVGVVALCGLPCVVVVVGLPGFVAGPLGDGFDGRDAVVRCGLPGFATPGLPANALVGAKPTASAMTLAGMVRMNIDTPPAEVEAKRVPPQPYV